MIKGTNFQVCDNSGILMCQCIHVYGSSKVSVGGLIRITAKRVVPNGKIKKGQKFSAVAVRSRKDISRIDGSKLNFSSNSAVILNEKHEMLGTRVFGPVASELRKNPNMLKIISLASEVV